MTALANRLKAAAVGFVITVAPTIIVALADFILLPFRVGTVDELNWERSDSLTFHAIVAIAVAIYWLISALLGRGQLLQLISANATLALSVFLLMFLPRYSFFFGEGPDDWKGMCPFLGISDTDAQPYALDARSSCGYFVDDAYNTLLLGLLDLSIVLLVTSLIVRIISSRRARSANA